MNIMVIIITYHDYYHIFIMIIFIIIIIHNDIIIIIGTTRTYALKSHPCVQGVSPARILSSFCAIFVVVLRRIAEPVIFHCEATNKYCGDLRRRRIRAKTAQKHVKIPAREIPYMMYV